ncbi:hypothetical protein DFH29DRAFT_1084049 [Suillus ampliporus]|nr:hypothetical protein DFH29DRAFT_1084049 [Suillus ampliporus]
MATLTRRHNIFIDIMCTKSLGVAETQQVAIHGPSEAHPNRIPCSNVIFQLLVHLNDHGSPDLLPHLVVDLLDKVHFRRYGHLYQHVPGTGGDPERLIHLCPGAVLNVFQVSDETADTSLESSWGILPHPQLPLQELDTFKLDETNERSPCLLPPTQTGTSAQISGTSHTLRPPSMSGTSNASERQALLHTELSRASSSPFKEDGEIPGSSMNDKINNWLTPALVEDWDKYRKGFSSKRSPHTHLDLFHIMDRSVIQLLIHPRSTTKNDWDKLMTARSRQGEPHLSRGVVDKAFDLMTCPQFPAFRQKYPPLLPGTLRLSGNHALDEKCTRGYATGVEKLIEIMKTIQPEDH